MERRQIINVAAFLNAAFVQVTTYNNDVFLGVVRGVLQPNHAHADENITAKSRLWLTRSTDDTSLFVTVSEVETVKQLTRAELKELTNLQSDRVTN